VTRLKGEAPGSVLADESLRYAIACPYTRKEGEVVSAETKVDLEI